MLTTLNQHLFQKCWNLIHKSIVMPLMVRLVQEDNLSRSQQMFVFVFLRINKFSLECYQCCDQLENNGWNVFMKREGVRVQEEFNHYCVREHFCQVAGRKSGAVAPADEWKRPNKDCLLITILLLAAHFTNLWWSETQNDTKEKHTQVLWKINIIL